MDPALLEARRRGDDSIEVAAVLRPGSQPPADLRVVATLGDVVTGRVPTTLVERVRSHPSVVSLKAARQVSPQLEIGSGRGVVLAVIDWGCDFANPAFRNEDGTTRLLALWDQRGTTGAFNRYGYGRIWSRDEIDRAIRSADPYATLGYWPTHDGSPAHGTHVMDIAAGSGRMTSIVGVAPACDLIFVHLGGPLGASTLNLGDSVRVIEALDFVRTTAGDRPLVVNLSLGRTGGDHTGRSPVERALDWFAAERPDRAVVQSCGNYFGRAMHATGRIIDARELRWLVPPGRRGPAELELWYSPTDAFEISVFAPDGELAATSRLGEPSEIVESGAVVGMAYHRARDPLVGDNHLDLFLDPDASPGPWRVRIEGRRVVNGRYDAWIERDLDAGAMQAHLDGADVSPFGSIGTIACGHHTISVGAIDRHGTPAPFSSAGPTRDGRMKPDLVAIGVGVPAARSTPAGVQPGHAGSTRMSGTSMAAPQVAGAIACLFSTSPVPLSIEETRALVLRTCRPLPGADPRRVGAGVLDLEALMSAARSHRKETPMQSTNEIARYLRSARRCGLLRGGFTIAGVPGELLRPPQIGDVIVRRFPSEGIPDLVAEVVKLDSAGTILLRVCDGPRPQGELVGLDVAGLRSHHQMVFSPTADAVRASEPEVYADEATATTYASIAVPVAQRIASDGDAHPGTETLAKYGISDWTRYTVYRFDVHGYSSYEQYASAKAADALAPPKGSFELSFDPLQYNELGGGRTGKKRMSILGASELVRRVHFLSDTALKETRPVKYGLAIYNLDEAVFSNGEGTRSAAIKLHGGGAYYSEQCGTSPLPQFKPAGSNTSVTKDGERKASAALLAFEQHLSSLLGISSQKPDALIVLPGRATNYPTPG